MNMNLELIPNKDDRQWGWSNMKTDRTILSALLSGTCEEIGTRWYDLNLIWLQICDSQVPNKSHQAI